MVSLYINNKFVIVPQTISVLEACETVGITVPRFCYHSQLSIAGNCRMCLVEIEKSPKPVASCAMPVAKNMKIFTDTALVKKAREGVLEFLLINHPLDCPICDQGGECDLQDQALTFGSDKSRFFDFKRGVIDKNISPLIKTIMTRCIHCTRCIRFSIDISGFGNMGTTNRGKETEIGVYTTGVINSELSGNLVDVCPVGALTSKPYTFSARPWELRSCETIDFSDSVGTNIVIEFKETDILRILPKQNDLVNRVWLSDRGRYSFDGYKNQRLKKPFINFSAGYKNTNWSNLLTFLTRISKFGIFSKGLINRLYLSKIINFSSIFSNIAIICSSTLSLEDFLSLKDNCSKLGIKNYGYTCKFTKFKNDFISNSCSNINYINLPNIEFFLLIASNPRFEASIFNVQLRKRFSFGLFNVCSIGLPHIGTFSISFIGVSSTFLSIFIEGQLNLCKDVINKNTAIIVGSSIFNRFDANLLYDLFSFLKKIVFSINHEKFLIDGFLNKTINACGISVSGISSVCIESLLTSQTIYLIGSDHSSDLVNSLISLDKLIVYSGTHNTFFLQSSDLVLPTLSLLETTGTFCNLEGSLQKSNIVTKSVTMAKKTNLLISFKTSIILETAFNIIPSCFFTKICFNSIETNIKNYSLHSGFAKPFYYSYKNRFCKLPFIASIFDFHLIDTVTNSSKVMIKCSQTTRLSHKNFIL